MARPRRIAAVPINIGRVDQDRHRRRSQRFFFGMLGAQMAVILSTFAMAAQRRNLLWSIAAAAGTVALAFTVYVLLFV